ncbi:peptidyl-glycine alpha-amidating monooxygenase-like [Mytilus californianus]|uniref:peptidyl-glycine alpha-amidating monooxygenase-like n=1 Tax=Mytilus californianus TaxID=6549 RepID=UPI0022463F4D|nr:peptidyl-glycine alpha-amidating monooxygenase-like [Mytilus californianus]
MKLPFPSIKINEPDQYNCYTRYLEELDEVYVLSTLIEINHDFVHHADLGFCEEPEDFASHQPWECSKSRKYCKGGAVGVYFFDDYFKPENGLMRFPKDISLKVGFSTMLRHITFEMHTKAAVTDFQYPLINVTLTFIKTPTKYNYQSHLLLTDGFIPANKEKGYFAEIACSWSKPDVVAYAVQVHTHHYGYTADVYRIRNGTWTLMVSQLTQGKAKVFVPVAGGAIDVRRGDVLAAKCLYINKDNKPVRFGQDDGQEMCNADIHFGYEFKYEGSFQRGGACMTQQPEFSFCDHEATSGICGDNSKINI